MAQTSKAKNDAEVALAVLRTMISIGDSTLAKVTGRLTLTQFRTLRVIADRTPVTMSRVADELGINPSSVTRACDRLTALDLLERAQNPLNRRETLLAPTAAGRQLVERVDNDRRAMLAAVFDRMSPADRERVAGGFEHFARSAAEALGQ